MIDLFFDTETTGFKREDFTPEIVQIAAILQDEDTRRVLASINLIVTPNGIIPDEVASIHGITTELARQYGFDQHAAESLFFQLVERCDRVVAHNIDFDLEMVRDNWPQTAQLIEEKQMYCTMREATPILKLPKKEGSSYHDDKYPDFKAPRLAEAHQVLCGAGFANAHDAMADTEACRDVYFAIQGVTQNAGE